jgi:hypothetical protein
MHLIESYATNCGLKIDKPFIYEKFFPLAFDKYITFSPSNDPAQDYDYWVEVINIIHPKLEKENIGILQLGNKGAKSLPNCLSAAGLTNRNQEAYLIKKTLLHFGIDNFLSQLAGAHDKKCVCLYSNNYAADVKPYWGTESNQSILESHRGGKKPSFSAAVENPKMINLIKPEDVAKSICKFLNLEYDFEYETVEVGSSYSNRIIETLPDQVVDIKSMNIDSIIVRMDYLFNEKFLIQQLNVGRASIVTDKPIDEKLIQAHKPSIKEVIYFINKDHDPKFVETLKRCAIKFMMVSDLSEGELEKIKIHYIDHGIIFPKEKKNVDHLKKEKLFYMSSKTTLSQGKMYPSRTALLENKPVDNQYQISEVIDNEEFWNDTEHHYFFKKA